MGANSIAYASNMGSLTGQLYLKNITSQLNTSIRNLNSGYRINTSADGPAQMAISQSFQAQIKSIGSAQTNVQQGISMLNAADQALQSIYTHITNIKNIATLAGNSSNSAADYTNLTTQLVKKQATITKLSATTFNGFSLLNNSIAGGTGFKIQYGPNSADNLDIKSAFGDATTATLGLSLAALTSAGDATTLQSNVTAALAAMGTLTGTIGGFSQQLQDQSDYLSVLHTNLTSSDNALRGTDVAAETANVTRLQVMQQASAAALSQANMQPTIALQLLKFAG